MKTQIRFIIACMAIVLLIGGGAYGSTQTVTANMSFDYAVMLVKNADIQFAGPKASTKGTYVISTSGVVKALGGGVIIGGTSAPGKITIAGSGTQTIAVSTGSYTAAGGVMLSAATCDYNGMQIGVCDKSSAGLTAPSSSGNVLKLGVTAVADGTQAEGTTFTPSFVVTVIYG